MQEQQYYLRKLRGDEGLHRQRQRQRLEQQREEERKKQLKRQRFIDPKDFSQVYVNPLNDLMPLLPYFLCNEYRLEQLLTQRSSEREEHFRQTIDLKYLDSTTPVKESAQSRELVSIISKQSKLSFFDSKNKILESIKGNKERMNSNREKTVNFIQKDLQVNLRDHGLLNHKQIQENWKKMEQIVVKKIAIVDSHFQQKQGIFNRVRKLVPATTEKKEILSVKHMNTDQQLTIYHIILSYLILPTQERLYQEIKDLDRKVQDIFKKFNNEEDEMRRVLQHLPYKEASFYWSKIIECCNHISHCEHYNDLQSQQVDQFEAEYAGLISHDTLKKLRENEWLDNTITSAVIEYLKHIEGANNFHSDNSFKAALFTHSETSIFMNNQRDLGGNYTSYEKLIFLVNHQNKHWFVITVYNSLREVAVYDSLPTPSSVYRSYCDKIVARLKNQFKRKHGKSIEFQEPSFSCSPAQSNTSDCGVFSIINMICAFDREKRNNTFSAGIIPEIRHSLFLFLLYLGYCKRLHVVPRKDYFDILFRSTIYNNMKSKLHLSKQERKR